MKFTVTYTNNFWKIDIHNQLLSEEESTFQKALNGNCKVKSVFLNNTVWSFDNLNNFTNSCVSLRDAGFLQE